MFSPLAEIACVFSYYGGWLLLMSVSCIFQIAHSMGSSSFAIYREKLRIFEKKTFESFIIAGTAVSMSFIARAYNAQVSSLACGILVILQTACHFLYLVFVSVEKTGFSTQNKIQDDTANNNTQLSNSEGVKGNKYMLSKDAKSIITNAVTKTNIQSFIKADILWNLQMLFAFAIWIEAIIIICQTPFI